MGIRVKAMYEEGVLKPIEKLDLPEKAKVRITISGSFSKLLDEVGEIEAKEDVDKVLENMRARDYYE
ncbi:MAG: antitoxin family protein [Methanophagales archaeon]|jgi:predicted DNA-binding antitoxin AbrB/MazE fold protein|nr:antitoxin family protein [Methanophagales archaeon]